MRWRITHEVHPLQRESLCGIRSRVRSCSTYSDEALCQCRLLMTGGIEEPPPRDLSAPASPLSLWTRTPDVPAVHAHLARVLHPATNERQALGLLRATRRTTRAAPRGDRRHWWKAALCGRGSGCVNCSFPYALVGPAWVYLRILEADHRDLSICRVTSSRVFERRRMTAYTSPRDR